MAAPFIDRKSINVCVVGMNSPFLQRTGTPIQSVYGQNIDGKVVIHKSFEEALEDIEGFERIWLIYWMDHTGPFMPKVQPYRDVVEYGFFATRSPNRPNPIGLSVVRFLRRDEATLYVYDIDILDETPLSDIKPYVPQFDCHLNSRAGWFEKAGVDRRIADPRFHHRGNKVK